MFRHRAVAPLLSSTTCSPAQRFASSRTNVASVALNLNRTRRTWSSSSTRNNTGPGSDQASKANAKHDNTNSGKPKSAFGRAVTVAKWTAFLGVSSVAGLMLLGAGIFIHDACTYTDKHVERVPVHPLALKPERGGPKNLPIAKALVADEEDEENRKLAQKPRLVIVGGGWGVCRSCL